MWYIWIYLGKSQPNSTHSVTLSLISSLSLGYSSNLSASPKTQNITPFVLDNTTPFSCIPVCLQSCIIYKPPPNQSHKNCIWSWKVFSQRCSKWVKRIKVCDSSERVGTLGLPSSKLWPFCYHLFPSPVASCNVFIPWFWWP